MVLLDGLQRGDSGFASHNCTVENSQRKDERTSKLSGKAALNAFWISYTYMLSLMLWIIFGTEFLGMPETEAGWYIISIMLVSSISFGLLRWYYGRKGDQ